jgi:alpha-tubulin suppressor-like RCC1 family protein
LRSRLAAIAMLVAVLSLVLPAASGTAAASVGLPTGVSAIAAGLDHTCAVTSGTVSCWGTNDHGQLGVDSTTTSESDVPVSVPGLGTVTAIAAGMSFTCALSGGTVSCWGKDNQGQLGDSGTVDSSTPVAATGLTGVTQIAAGGEFACALASGVVHCWGADSDTQLGDGGAAVTSAPVAVTGITDAVSISAGEWHACAVHATGTVSCWGNNGYGQIGNGLQGSAAGPVLMSGVTNAVQVSAGNIHTCVRLSDGSGKCTGYNVDGRLGIGNTFNTIWAPTAVVALAPASSIVAGGIHSCAITSGTVWCWGHNQQGELGDGTIYWSLIPVQVHGITTAVSLALGNAHSCALLADQSVRCWGYNSAGQLGDASTTQRLLPVQVRGFFVPNTANPTLAIRTGAQLVGATLPVVFAWVGGDGTGFGIAGYRVDRMDPTSVWSLATASTPASPLTTTITSAGLWGFRARATDGFGHSGAWATRVGSSSLVQQSSTTIKYHGVWTTASSAAYSGKSVKWAKAAGAYATITTTATSLGIVSTKGPGMGKLKVYVNGVLTATVDLKRASTQYRMVVWSAVFPNASSRTIKLVVVGTAGRPRVDLDAVALLN